MNDRDISLPKGWAIAAITEVAHYFRGVSYQKSDAANSPSEGYIPILRANNLGDGFNLRDLVYVPSDCVASDQLVCANDIVLAMSSGSKKHVGKSVLAIADMECAFGAFCGLLRPRSSVVAKFLSYQLEGRNFRRYIEKSALGTNINNLKSSDLLAYKIFLAPKAEQQRIIIKIDELFSGLDKGVEGLIKAREQLQAYRQSVLKSAFEGKLTNAHITKGANWPLRSVSTLLSAPLCNGRSVKDRAGGFPVLRLTALKDGMIDLTESKEGDWDRTSALPFLVTTGDFLVARGNGSKHLVGTGGIVGEIEQETAYPDTMIRLRLDQSQVSPQFFSLCWNSRILRDQIERDARTTAGIYKINQDHVSAFTLPLPSLAEQTEIVRILVGKLEAVDLIEAEIEAGLARANALRQSILKRAFSGQLVAQDEVDEPASELLEHIRAESEGCVTTKRRNTKNNKKEAA